MSTAELEQFVAELGARPELWNDLIRHSSEARQYEQIWASEDVNAWLICWSETQDTGFHDHDESAAAILVLEGQVREERLRRGTAPDGRVAGPGTVLIVPPTAIHRVLHAGSAPAVTIHAYSPPLQRTGAYWIGPQGQIERTAQSFEEELRSEPALR
jgi:quercetin dioxygenase-like cupin family protein